MESNRQRLSISEMISARSIAARMTDDASAPAGPVPTTMTEGSIVGDQKTCASEPLRSGATAKAKTPPLDQSGVVERIREDGQPAKIILIGRVPPKELPGKLRWS